MSLGRGLGALISSTASKKNTPISDSGDSRSEKVWQVSLAKIVPGRKQPRQNFKPENLAELAESIKKHGILQPVILAELPDGGYELIAGERRWRAAKIAGMATVPALVKQFEDQEKLEVALIENIQREDLNPLEEAFAFKRLIEEFNLTQQQVAEKVGKSRPAVANTIRLLELPPEIQKALVDGKISAGQARALLSMEGTKAQLEMLSSMLGEKITVRELEREVNKRRTDKTSLRRDPNLAYLEDQLRLALGTRVSITQKGENGTVVINYYSKEELTRLIKRLSE